MQLPATLRQLLLAPPCWLEQFAAPYYVVKAAGVAITLASALGGQAPLAAKSDDPAAQSEATNRFRADTQPPRYWPAPKG